MIVEFTCVLPKVYSHKWFLEDLFNAHLEILNSVCKLVFSLSNSVDQECS